MTPTEGMDSGADALETPIVESSAETVEAPVEGAEVETTEEAPPAAGQSYRAVSEDGKRLDEKARATIDEIRTKDPALAKAFRDAIFAEHRLREKFPGGLTEATELKQTLETLGGAQGIEGIQAEVKGWNDFDQNYMAGDPKALEFMLSSPESQQAFMKLAPMAFNKFEELNPEGYASYLCQRIVGDAVANRVPISMELAQHYLAAGDATKAAEEFAKVVGWFQGLDATAKKPIAPPKTQAPEQENSRLKELETQNTEQTRTIWMNEYAPEQNKLYVGELTRLLGDRKISDNIRANILHYVTFKLDSRFKQDQKNFDRYLTARDRDGFQKYAKSFDSKNIPGLLREAVDKFVAAKPGPKVNQVPQGGKPITPPLNGKPVEGFTRVDKMPTRDQIDWGHPFNTLSNTKLGRAITVDGKKVSWK